MNLSVNEYSARKITEDENVIKYQCFEASLVVGVSTFDLGYVTILKNGLVEPIVVIRTRKKKNKNSSRYVKVERLQYQKVDIDRLITEKKICFEEKSDSGINSLKRICYTLLMRYQQSHCFSDNYTFIDE